MNNKKKQSVSNLERPPVSSSILSYSKCLTYVDSPIILIECNGSSMDNYKHGGFILKDRILLPFLLRDFFHSDNVFFRPKLGLTQSETTDTGLCLFV